MQNIRKINDLIFEDPGKWGINLMFHSNDQVAQGVLAEEAELMEIKFCNEISFFESGKVRAGRLSEQIWIKGVPAKIGRKIYFYESGKIRSFMPDKGCLIENYPFREGQFIDLDEDGKVMGGCIGKDIEIDGERLKEDTFVRIKNNKMIDHLDLFQEIWNMPSFMDENFYCHVTSTEVICGSEGQRKYSARCTYRDFLEGTFIEMIPPERSSEVREKIQELYRKISDVPVSFVLN